MSRMRYTNQIAGAPLHIRYDTNAGAHNEYAGACTELGLCFLPWIEEYAGLLAFDCTKHRQ